MDTRPESVEQFRGWSADKLGYNFADEVKLWFRQNQGHLRTEFDGSAFGAELLTALGEAHALYGAAHGGNELFAGGAPSEVVWSAKSFGSTVNKLYRLNCVWNRRWPKPPRDGWTGPSDCFDNIDDLIRARLVCNYLDGPVFVGEKLVELATKHGLESKLDSRERDEGYYAHHLYVEIPWTKLRLDRGTENTMSKIEIQLTTVMQELLSGLTHRNYEARRLESHPDRKQWKWQHDSFEFKSAYLAHTLHMLEGMILEVRDQDLKQEVAGAPLILPGEEEE